MLQDLRFAARLLWRTPSFAIVAAGTLAVGIAANAVVFSLVNALLFQPVQGVRDAPHLVALYTSDFSSGPYGSTSYLDYLDVVALGDTFAALAADTSSFANLAAADAAERVRTSLVTPNYFDVLGVPLASGRPLRAEDGDPATRGVVISSALWTRLGAPNGILGSRVRLDGEAAVVVGVAGEGFRGVRLGELPDVWIPLGPQSTDPDARGNRGLNVIGRLAPGVTVAQAQARVTALAARLAASYPRTNLGTLQRPTEPRPFFVVPHTPLGPDAGDATFISTVLAASVALLLVLASANVANLFLARAVAREQDAAIRIALGAGTARVVRATIAEAIVVAAAGGVAGLLAAAWTADLLPALLPQDAVGLRPAIDWRVLLLTAGVSIASGACSAILAAWHRARVPPITGLRGARETTDGRGRAQARRVLVGVQVALAVVLLIGAALFLQTLRSAVAIQPGIEPDGLTIASVELRGQRYAGDARGAFYARLRDELAADAGVAAVSFARTLPLAGGISRRGVRFEGYTLSPGEDREMPVNVVDRDFFKTMRAAVVAGREFGPNDTAASEPVALVSEALSRRYFKGHALGRRIRMSDGRLRTIIGIAGAIKYRNVREQPLPVVYLAMAQEPQLRATIAVRARDGAAATERTLRAAVRRVDADLPVFGAQTMREYVSLRAGQERLIAVLLAVCGAAALLLAGVGVYGVTAYGAARRTREFGIRMALGATPSGIRRIVLLQTVRMTVAGVVVGAIAARLLGPLVESALFGTTAANPAVTGAAAALLVLIALVASYGPARRATRVDPVVALRAE